MGNPSKAPTPDHDEVEFWPAEYVLAFFGGEKPIHISTFYRGMQSGFYPRPVNVAPNVVRWLGHECRAARERIIAARDKPKPLKPGKRPRGRPHKHKT